jgi:hypothetical protein
MGFLLPARVAKLVDALASGASVLTDVLVRVQSRAPRNMSHPKFSVIGRFGMFSF